MCLTEVFKYGIDGTTMQLHILTILFAEIGKSGTILIGGWR